ncbi:MAG: erythromycin esterase family protein [Armatimonas sp.]
MNSLKGAEFSLWNWQDSEHAPLLKALNGVTLLQLGEATHGGAELYQLKTNLVRFLSQQAGFRCLLTESGFLETCLAGLESPRKPAATLLDETFFQNFCWKETLPLFTLLSSTPSLKFFGVDPQFGSNKLPAVLERTVKPYDTVLATELRQRIGECYQLFGLTSSPDKYRQVQKSYFDWLTDIQQKLSRLKIARRDEQRFEILKHGLANLKPYWDFAPEKLFSPERNVLRDRLMAENAEWLLARFARKDKAIFWAHNGHIGKVPWYTTTGQLLAEKRKQKSYALGITARKGSFYNHVSRKTEPWATIPDGIETLLAPQSAEAIFYNFRAQSSADSTRLKQPQKGFEPENGGNFAYSAGERFDGMMVLESISPPAKL